MSAPAPVLNNKDLANEEIERLLKKALRKRDGVASESDLIVDSGVPAHQLGPVLREMVSAYECALDVTEDGDIIYRFDKRLQRRDEGNESLWKRFKRGVWRVFKKTYKATIAVVLVGYVLVFVALIIAAMVAAQSQNRDSKIRIPGSSNRRGGGGGFWFWYWVWGRPSYRRQRHRHRAFGRWHRTNRGGKKAQKDDRPFYKKVFSFVFGAEDEDLEPLYVERELLSYIRSRGGVISPTELTSRTGWELDAAERESTRLLARYDGEVEITDDGEMIYVFPELMKSAHDAEVANTSPAPAFWERWEQKLSLTGNTAGANFGIALLNAFVFFGAVAATPGYIAPNLELDLGNPLVWGALMGFPALYSVLFFAVPFFRKFFSVDPENKRRAQRNMRRAVLRDIFYESIPVGEVVDVDVSAQRIVERLPEGVPVASRNVGAIKDLIHSAAREFRAEEVTTSDGRVGYVFERIADEAKAVKLRKKKTDRRKFRIGEQALAYSSDETVEATDAKHFDSLIAASASTAEATESVPVEATAEEPF